MNTLQNLRRVGNPQPTAPHGGQASGPGIFGLGRRSTIRFTHVPAAPRPSQAQGDDQARRLGGLSFGQRRALIQARVAAGAARFFAQAAAGDPFDSYGLARPSTPAMQQVARESAERSAQDWRELAELAATSEWNRHAAQQAEALAQEGN